MMPIKGLDPKEIVFPKKVLPARGGLYFSAIALSMWDNIHGPKVLQVWQGPPPGQEAEESPPPTDKSDPSFEDTLKSHFEVSDATLLSVANYSLNDEAARAEDIVGIESKFYSLSKFNLIAYTSIFTIELSRGRTEVLSFLLILPITESEEFLSRYVFCDLTVQRLLQEHIIRPLSEAQKERRDTIRGSVKARIDEVLMDFDKPLMKFTQSMLSLKQNQLPNKINLADTFLGKESGRQDLRIFLNQAVTSYLQTSGYAIIMGSNRDEINKMILTLGMFLSVKERKMSRMVGSEGDDEPAYEPHLFLQGLVIPQVKKRDVYPSTLPFTKGQIYLNKLPHTIIYLDDKQVLLVEPKVNYFLGTKEEAKEIPEKKMKGADSPLLLKDLKEMEKDMASPMIKDFLLHLWQLNTVGGVRETFISQFLRFLKLKALALAKYLDNDVKVSSNSLDKAAEMLALMPPTNNTAEKIRATIAALQQDLAIDCGGDMLVVLAFTEKIRPRTFLDVLGDPQLDNLAVIEEFASL